MSLHDNNNSFSGFSSSGMAGSIDLGGATMPMQNSITAAERRAKAGNGHVRLSGRDANLLSQMRNQYRKVFGVFFDPMEFTGNDLYARATLRQCIASGNGELSAMAAQFLDEEGKPRLHRRLGHADLEIESDLPALPGT